MRILRQQPDRGVPVYFESGLTDPHLERAITHELRHVAAAAGTPQGTIYRLYSYTYQYGKPYHSGVDEVFVLVVYLDFLDRGEVAIVTYAEEGSTEELEEYGR